MATYNDGPCVDDSTCKESLICRTDTSHLFASSCNCPLNVNIGYCDCPRSKNNETFWDGKFIIISNQELSIKYILRIDMQTNTRI
jgi:hypothetical protein